MCLEWLGPQKQRANLYIGKRLVAEVKYFSKRKGANMKQHTTGWHWQLMSSWTSALSDGNWHWEASVGACQTAVANVLAEAALGGLSR